MTRWLAPVLMFALAAPGAAFAQYSTTLVEPFCAGITTSPNPIGLSDPGVAESPRRSQVVRAVEQRAAAMAALSTAQDESARQAALRLRDQAMVTDWRLDIDCRAYELDHAAGEARRTWLAVSSDTAFAVSARDAALRAYIDASDTARFYRRGMSTYDPQPSVLVSRQIMFDRQRLRADALARGDLAEAERLAAIIIQHRQRSLELDLDRARRQEEQRFAEYQRRVQADGRSPGLTSMDLRSVGMNLRNLGRTVPLQPR